MLCDVRLEGTERQRDRGIFTVEHFKVEVINLSSRMVTGIVCEVPLHGFDSPLPLGEALAPGGQVSQKHPVLSEFEVYKEDRHVGDAEFTFSLDEVAWSKR